MKTFALVWIGLGLGLSLGMEKTASAAAAVPQLPAGVAEYPWLGDNYLATEGPKARKRAKRSVASIRAVNETLMSSELKAFRDKFLSVKKAEEIDPLLVELEGNYENYPADLKFVAAQLIPLRTLKSIVWRLAPVVDRPKITHSMLLSMVQGWAARMKILFPTEQWDAGFAYVTEPFEGGPAAFKTLEDFQAYAGAAIYREMFVAAKRMESLDFSQAPAVFDNKLLYGSASFQDDLDRYKELNEAERHAALVTAHAGLASVAIFCAYQVTGTLDLAKDLGQIYGVDSLWWDIEGATAQKRAEIIRKPKYAALGTLTEHGAKWTRQAFLHVKHSVRKTRLVWEELRGRPADEFAVLDPAKVIPWNREIESRLKEMEAMISGETELRSRVTGEVVRVNLPKLFLEPPQDLKAFLPTSFENSSEYLSKARLRYRNYFRGRAIDWDLKTYQAYLPGLASGKDVAAQVRILRQSWGGWATGLPLAGSGR
ncbi:MAG: hypothetical protein NDJ89_17195 [Oligoflexia bacterium]|nr:hypothetical protein [Oligoflexia bacterium]